MGVTVMNLGMYGIKSCAPIIRQPQAVALAFGAAENRIVPNDDKESEEIYKESIMLTANFSHNLVLYKSANNRCFSAFTAARKTSLFPMSLYFTRINALNKYH